MYRTEIFYPHENSCVYAPPRRAGRALLQTVPLNELRHKAAPQSPLAAASLADKLAKNATVLEEELLHAEKYMARISSQKSCATIK